MHKRNETANCDILQLILDAAVVFFSYCLANFLYVMYSGSQIFFGHLWICGVFAVIFILSMYLLRMYNITTFQYMDRLIKRTVISAIVAGMTLSLVVFMAHLEQTSRLLFGLFCLLSCMMVLLERVIMRLFNQMNFGNGWRHTIFVGDDETLRRYMTFIRSTSIKLKIDRYISFKNKNLLTPESFSKILMELSVDEVHFVNALDGSKQLENLEELLETCESMGVTARIILDTFDLPVAKRYISSIGTYPVITYHCVSQDKFQLFIKSVIDMIGAVIGLICFSPIFLVTAIAIKLDSPGPVLFKQKRVGVYGNIFHIYKFRSMHKDAEARKHELASMNKIKDGLMFKIDDDPRITRVGKLIRKTSIDELPQLINVLKREMSLVGTRPPTTDEVSKYSPDQWRRISIRPGITGMWQVNGRSQILDFDDVVKLDKKYIDEWSLLLDIKLLFRTVKAVFTTQGAH